MPAYGHRLLELLPAVRREGPGPRRPGRAAAVQLAERHLQGRLQCAGADRPGRQGDRDGPAGHRRHHRRTPAPGGEEDPGRERGHPPRRGQGLHGRTRRQPRLRREVLRLPRQEAGRQGPGRRTPGRPQLDQRAGPLGGVRVLHEEEVPEDHRASSWPPTGRARSPPAKLQSLLAQHPDLDGIYMQAGGAFLQPTLALLEQKKLLEAGRLPTGTSPSSPTTASRTNWPRSAPGRSTPPSPSPPTSTPSTRCTTPRPAWRGRPSRRARPTTARPS